MEGSFADAPTIMGPSAPAGGDCPATAPRLADLRLPNLRLLVKHRQTRPIPRSRAPERCWKPSPSWRRSSEGWKACGPMRPWPNGGRRSARHSKDNGRPCHSARLRPNQPGGGQTGVALDGLDPRLATDVPVRHLETVVCTAVRRRARSSTARCSL